MALKFSIYGDSTPPVNVGTGAGFQEVIVATAGQTAVPIVGRYRVETGELKVYLNGIRQIVNVDYTETNEHVITFIEPLEEGENVFVVVDEIINQSLYQAFVAGEGQLSFTLNKAYHVGMHTLQVHENGMLLRVNEDYIEEEDGYTVTFLTPPKLDARITFREVV